MYSGTRKKSPEVKDMEMLSNHMGLTAGNSRGDDFKKKQMSPDLSQ